MPIRQATPDGGGRSRPDSFKYYWTEPDQPWSGWCAGPVNWIRGHTDPGPTKPCLRWITYGALPCPRCKPKEIPADIGYLCVYREVDHAPLLLVLHDNMYDVVKNFRYGEYLKISRPGGPEGPVCVQLLANKKVYNTTLARRKKAIDSTAMLIRMWDINELEEWYKMQEGIVPSDSSVLDSVPLVGTDDPAPQALGFRQRSAADPPTEKGESVVHESLKRTRDTLKAMEDVRRNGKPH